MHMLEIQKAKINKSQGKDPPFHIQFESYSS